MIQYMISGTSFVDEILVSSHLKNYMSMDTKRQTMVIANDKMRHKISNDFLQLCDQLNIGNFEIKWISYKKHNSIFCVIIFDNQEDAMKFKLIYGAETFEDHMKKIYY